jgi:hypothetical protein
MPGKENNGKAEVPSMNDMVSVKLPRTKEKTDDVFVSLNGRNMKIQRGAAVQIPRWAYEILKNSEDMDELALENQKKMTKSFA